jgi:hypothetical protein
VPDTTVKVLTGMNGGGAREKCVRSVQRQKIGPANSVPIHAGLVRHSGAVGAVCKAARFAGACGHSP